MSQEGTALSIQVQATPTATLSPFERLAEPTLPSSPTQADYGAYDYWLLCLPCHGDRGQGLTDEFRTTYPPEEQFCWERGCHGERPYENGFTLPAYVPPVIGPSAALEKFSNAALLKAYISAAMPFWNPGSLTEEESWNIIAFLLRENGIPLPGKLDLNTPEQILLSTAPTPTKILPTPTLASITDTDPEPPADPSTTRMLALALLVSVLVIILVLVFVLRRQSF